MVFTWCCANIPRPHCREVITSVRSEIQELRQEPRSSVAQSHNPGAIAAIAVAELFGTSLWFSANSAADDLRRAWGIGVADIGLLTSAVQLGFILGTLGFSLSGVADGFKASRIFAACAVLGAVFNGCFALASGGMTSALIFRFAVGICLAGIYPIGMKLVVSWSPERTGSALSYLVGMLTLGTALPHALRFIGAQWKWQYIMLGSSILAVTASIIILSLGDGPHLSITGKRPSSRAGGVLQAFKSQAFRAAAFGYFGHMWELYTFWTLAPALVVKASIQTGVHFNVPGCTFAIIAAGALGCILGGIWSRRIGSARVAAVALSASGLCCFIFAMEWRSLPASGFVVLFLVWGFAVVTDSPQFSALSARACPRDLVGSALAIQNSAGFAITIVSIALATAVFDRLGLSTAWLLLPGPILGLAGFYPLWRQDVAR